MNQIVVRRHVPPDKEHDLLGEFARRQDYDDLVTEPSLVVGEDGSFIAAYGPGMMARTFSAAWARLSAIKIATDNRGLATGKGVKKKPEPGKTNRVNRELAEWPYSGTLGSFEANSRHPLCRLTAFTKQNADVFFGDLLPVWKQASEAYRLLLPEDHAAQMKTVREQVKPDWVVPGTPFTTITINNTYRTAYHRDAGDLIGPGVAWSVLCAGWADGVGAGGHLVLPAFRTAFQMGHGDVLVLNPHEIHGNTPIGRVERVSLVLYVRDKVRQCGTFAEEREAGVKVSERRFFGKQTGAK
jgi:hypothetical protein